MKYFVTGATGFVGGHVVRQLVAMGHEVVASVRPPAKAQNLADLGVSVHQGDVTDNAGESYIIAGPTHTLVEVTQLAQKVTGVPAPRMHVSPFMMKTMVATMSVVEKVVPDDYSAEYLRINAGVTYIGSNAKARREFGYNPRPLEEGLSETLNHEMRLLGMK